MRKSVKIEFFRNNTIIIEVPRGTTVGKFVRNTYHRYNFRLPMQNNKHPKKYETYGRMVKKG